MKSPKSVREGCRSTFRAVDASSETNGALDFRILSLAGVFFQRQRRPFTIELEQIVQEPRGCGQWRFRRSKDSPSNDVLVDGQILR